MNVNEKAYRPSNEEKIEKWWIGLIWASRMGQTASLIRIFTCFLSGRLFNGCDVTD